MKKLSYIFSLIILAGSFALVGCSDDANNQSIDITFPELETVSHKIGETGTITIDAAANWKLTSSALWLKFVDEDMEEDELYGQAGKHTITYIVKEDGANFESSNKASIALTMNNQRQVIYQITRQPLAYEITAIDAEGNAINAENPLNVAYGATTTLKLTANYTFKAEFPKWIEVVSGMNGEANKEVIVTIKPDADFKKNPNEGIFSVTNATFDAAATFEFPMTYAGMDPMVIEFTHVPWNWEFLADGLQYSKTNIDGDTDIFDLPMKFNVSALNDSYQIIKVEHDPKWGAIILDEYTEWFYTDDMKGGNIEVTCSANNGQARTGTLLIFPAAKFAEFGDDLDAALLDDQGGVFYLKAEMEQFIALNFTQKAIGGSSPFRVVYESMEMELISLVDNIGEEAVLEQYGTKDVFILGVENYEYENINIFFNDANVGESIFADTYFNGENTMWSGVDMEPKWSEDYRTYTTISGIRENCSNGKQMIISFLNGTTERLIGVIIVEQW